VFGETYFAGGILLTIVGWMWLGLIESTLFRAVTRSFLIAACITPSVIIGEGIAVVPAIVLLLSPHYHKIGLIPNLVSWVVSFLVIVSFPVLRTSKTEKPVQLAAELFNPPYFKLLLYGIIVFLLIAGNFNLLYNWYISVVVVFGGLFIHYFLCLFAARFTEKKSWLLALPFPIPMILVGGHYPSLGWFLAGVAGVMMGTDKRKMALLMGALTSTVMFLSSVHSTISAIKYGHMPHVKISGGILGNGILAGIFFIGAILFLVFQWKYKRQVGNRGGRP
jgi:hypothetical protein